MLLLVILFATIVNRFDPATLDILNCFREKNLKVSVKLPDVVNIYVYGLYLKKVQCNVILSFKETQYNVLLRSSLKYCLKQL